jgi:hypothetical protein
VGFKRWPESAVIGEVLGGHGGGFGSSPGATAGLEDESTHSLEVEGCSGAAALALGMAMPVIAEGRAAE